MGNSDNLEKLKGTDQAFNRLIDDARLAAATPFNVLMFGETGTGKTLIAEGIHQASNRASKEFVTVDLGLMHQETQDAELFGYVGGAFTGAGTKGRKGLFVEADGGTVFFDEVGDASPATQSKLLRLLQERMIRPMGSNKESQVDIRVIAATNRNLKQMIEDGTFREDLYFRLKVIVLNVPSLVDRGRDSFDRLTDLFLMNNAMDKTPLTIEDGARDFLWEYPLGWPGNIRELEATIQRLIALCENSVITRDIADVIIERQVALDEKPATKRAHTTLREARHVAGKKQILQALKQSNGNRKEAAQELDVSPPSVPI